MQEHHGARGAQFGSKIGFILASVGSAIGMGNIWMFPYRVGQYGGAAFLIPYFLFVALFGAVGLSGEFALGRLTGTGPVGSYDYAMRTRGLRGGKLLGAIRGRFRNVFFADDRQVWKRSVASGGCGADGAVFSGRRHQGD